MKIAELLTESTPRTLYHGTLMKFVPTIMEFGLLPSIGEFTRRAYQEYTDAGIDLEPLVFAADKKDLRKCVGAMVSWLKQHGIPVTEENFYKKTALIVIKQGEKHMQYRKDEFDFGHPDTVEPGDYYSSNTVLPTYYITGNKLKSFLQKNSVNLEKFIR